MLLYSCLLISLFILVSPQLKKIDNGPRSAGVIDDRGSRESKCIFHKVFHVIALIHYLNLRLHLFKEKHYYYLV